MAKEKKSIISEKDQHLKQMRDRLDAAVSNEKDERTKGMDDLKFINGEQWEQAVLNDRVGRVNVTINKMPTYLDQVDGDIRLHKPGIKVKAIDSVSDPDTADVIEGLIRMVERTSVASRVYSYAGVHLAACGRGAWRIRNDYVSEKSFIQTIKIERIENPYAVYYDPSAIQEDKQDGKFMFLIQEISKEVYKDEYGNDPVDFSVDGSEFANWQGDNSVRVAEYFYRKKIEDKTLYLLKDGRVVEEPQEDDVVENTRKVPISEIWWEKVDGKRIIDGPERIPGNMFPVILVWGKQLFVDGKLEVRGIARHAKDSQRLYNYFSSNDAETTALQPKQPYIMPDSCLGPYKSTWDKSSDENYPYLPFVVDPANPSLRPYREAPAMVSGGNSVQLQRADQDMRDTIGIQKAALGMTSNETSGKAINARKVESDTGQYAFLDNLSAGVRTTGKIILGMIPEVYDTARQERILGPDYKEKIVKINQEGGIDLTTGMYDVDIDVGPSFSTQREEFLEKITAILPNIPPQQTAMITDILFEMMDFSRADDIAERLKKLLPPEILGITETSREGGTTAPGGAPPTAGNVPPSPPQPPPPDPMLEIAMQTAHAKLVQEKMKAEQEKAKLELLQIEMELKHATGKENVKKLIEEMMREGERTPIEGRADGGSVNANQPYIVGEEGKELFIPKQDGEIIPGYGLREDGTPKGRGWLGELKRPDGKVSSELSIGVNLDGKEILIPSLVPTLTQEEVNYLLNGGHPTQEIVNKSVEHAKERMKQGLSPFKD